MTTRLSLTHALLWAAAIVAASLLHAATLLWMLVLPGLATMALLTSHMHAAPIQARSRRC